MAEANTTILLKIYRETSVQEIMERMDKTTNQEDLAVLQKLLNLKLVERQEALLKEDKFVM